MSGTDPVHVRNIEKIIYYCDESSEYHSFSLYFLCSGLIYRYPAPHQLLIKLLYVILKAELEKLFDFSIREIIYEKDYRYYSICSYPAYGRLQFSS